jgi:type II secretion system protein N
MSKFKIISLYILLGLFTLCLTIIITFPLHGLEQIISQSLSRKTGLQIYLTGLKLEMPAGLKTKNLTIQPLHYNPVILSQVQLKLHPLSFFSGQTELDMEAKLWEGLLFFNTCTNGIKNWSTMHISLNFNNLQLAHIKPYLNIASYIKSLQALLSGDLDLTIPAQFNPQKINGHGKFDLQKGSTRFDTILFKNISLHNIQANIQFAVQNGHLEIKQGNIKADGITGKISGTLTFKKRLPSSLLNLKISANVNANTKGFPDQIKPFLKKKNFQIKLKGTIAFPKISG